MSYFITGGTGFIGRFFIERLLARESKIHVLTRRESLHKFEKLAASFGDAGERLQPVFGDLTQPALGLDKSTVEELADEYRFPLESKGRFSQCGTTHFGEE